MASGEKNFLAESVSDIHCHPALLLYTLKNVLIRSTPSFLITLYIIVASSLEMRRVVRRNEWSVRWFSHCFSRIELLSIFLHNQRKELEL